MKPAWGELCHDPSCSTKANGVKRQTALFAFVSRVAFFLRRKHQEGRPPEITPENAAKMGVAELDDPSVYIVAK